MHGIYAQYTHVCICTRTETKYRKSGNVYDKASERDRNPLIIKSLQRIFNDKDLSIYRSTP